MPTTTAIKVITLPEVPTSPQPGAPHPKIFRREYVLIAFLLVLAFFVRFYALLQTGVEVDEPIYRNAAATALQLGYPAIRPAYLHPVVPFLYHPPFYLWLLAGWFKLWGSTSYFTGRLLSVIISLLLLLFLYLFVKNISNKKVAFLTLFLVGCDPWIIFTNQAIYLENSLALFVLFALWAYWRATCIPEESRGLQLRWYALAGLLAGWVVIYKQIGGYVFLVFLLNLFIQRKHWLGHLVLCAGIGAMLLLYASSMHLTFGSAFDAATLDQFHRTIGAKAAPGLNDSITQAVQAVWNEYKMFLVTIVVLLGGSVLVCIRYLQTVMRRRTQPYHSIFISWALGGIIFALAISLKSPHYLILWLIPLYTFLAHEAIQKLKLLPSSTKKLQIGQFMLALLFILGAGIGDMYGFQARFTHIPGDTLLQSDAYINATLPPDAIVLTENYIGVDIQPPFLDITLVDTPQLVLQKGVTYMALYWSNTQPIPPSLGSVNRYCLPMKKFAGFKDFVEVCKIDPIALAIVVSTHTHPKPLKP